MKLWSIVIRDWVWGEYSLLFQSNLSCCSIGLILVRVGIASKALRDVTFGFSWSLTDSSCISENNVVNVSTSLLYADDKYTFNGPTVSWNCDLFLLLACSWNTLPFISAVYLWNWECSFLSFIPISWLVDVVSVFRVSNLIGTCFWLFQFFVDVVAVVLFPMSTTSGDVLSIVPLVFIPYLIHYLFSF